MKTDGSDDLLAHTSRVERLVCWQARSDGRAGAATEAPLTSETSRQWHAVMKGATDGVEDDASRTLRQASAAGLPDLVLEIECLRALAAIAADDTPRAV